MTDRLVDRGAASPTGNALVTLFAPRLLDPASGRIRRNALVTIRGGRVESITEGAPGLPVADETAGHGQAQPVSIALPESWTALPGLIDSHTHLLLQPFDAVKSPILYKSQAFRTVEGVAAAKRTLEAGFTTVRDVDSEGTGLADVALRDAINQAIVPGPRMFVAGEPLTITGGYMNSLGYSPDITVPDLGVSCDSIPAMVTATRRNLKYGVDLIKIYATASLPQVTPDFQPFSQVSVDEVRAVVTEAARWRKDVAAHAYGGDGARNAILGGVRSIEHGLFLDRAIIELLVDKGVFWCPTLWVYNAEPGLDRFGEAFMTGIKTRHRKGFEAALKAGVKIAFGTDAGGFEAGENASEFKVMVEFGMSPLDAIRSATTVGAELLRKETDLGAVAPGHHADIIAVAGDPLEDISTLEQVVFVMKGGTVVKGQI
jgi:imidazolonepropionase-like amidohydrolase